MHNVMIVDDSVLIRRVLSKALVELGCNVVGEAKDGQEAVDLYPSCNPDLVTIDITMPKITGIEALKEIKKSHPNIKAIMMTSHGEEKIVKEALAAGAKGYTLKPITPKKVKVVVEKFFPDLFE